MWWGVAVVVVAVVVVVVVVVRIAVVVVVQEVAVAVVAVAAVAVVVENVGEVVEEGEAAAAGQRPNTRSRLAATCAFAVQKRLRRMHRPEPPPGARRVLTMEQRQQQ